MCRLILKHVRSHAIECLMSRNLNNMALGRSAGRGTGWDEGRGLGRCPSVQPLPGGWCGLKLTTACEWVKDGDEVAYLTKTSNRRFCRGFIALAKRWMNRTNQIWLFENVTGKGNNFSELVLSLSNNASFPPPFLRCSRDPLVTEVTVFHSPYRWRCWGGVGGCSALCHVTQQARGSLEKSSRSGLCEPRLALAIITDAHLTEEHTLRE